MIRRPPRSTLSSSSAASDVYKRQFQHFVLASPTHVSNKRSPLLCPMYHYNDFRTPKHCAQRTKRSAAVFLPLCCHVYAMRQHFLTMKALHLVHGQIVEPLSKQWPPTSPPPAATPKSAPWRKRFHCNTLRYILQCRFYNVECIARSCAQAQTPHPTQPPHRPSIAAGRSPGALAAKA